MVQRFVDALDFDDAERAEVETWLNAPPEPISVDTEALSQEQRVVYSQAIQAVILADGEIAPEERRLFQKLLP